MRDAHGVEHRDGLPLHQKWSNGPFAVCSLQGTANAACTTSDVGRRVADSPVIPLTHPTGLCLVGATPTVHFEVPKSGAQNGRVGTKCGHGTRNNIHGSLSMVCQYGPKGSSTRGRDAGGVVLAAQAERAARGSSGGQCTAAVHEGTIRSGGPRRGTTTAHKTTKETEGPTVQARAAKHTQGHLGTGTGISRYVDYSVITHSKRRHNQNEERAPKGLRTLDGTALAFGRAPTCSLYASLLCSYTRVIEMIVGLPYISFHTSWCLTGFLPRAIHPLRLYIHRLRLYIHRLEKRSTHHFELVYRHSSSKTSTRCIAALAAETSALLFVWAPTTS